MKKETEQQINQLQMIEQGLQSLLVQKQQFQSQLMEIESAEKELKTTPRAYKIIGNIMVQKSKEELEKDLLQKRERVEIRLKSIEKQEEKSKEKIKELQEKVMKDMNTKT